MLMRAHKNQALHIRLRYASTGLVHALRSERSVRFHVAAFLLVIIVLLRFHPGPIWWALVILASMAVLAAELINTAIEHLADHLHPDTHAQIQVVKDCAAAAVLVAVVGALAVGASLLIHLANR
jgi:undecaprenol kinase